MKCALCQSYERKIGFTKGDLGDSRHKLVRAQVGEYAGSQARIESLTDEIVRLQARLEDEETNLAAHQAEEHAPDKPPTLIGLDFDRAPSHRLDEDDKSALIAMLADGVPRAEIAEAFGVSLSAVQYYATQTGHQQRPRHEETVSAAPVGRLFHFPEWFADALCSQTDPEMFHPEKGGSTREAKSVCRRCTVAAECLDYALDNQERFGIWGGLSERERRPLARQLNSTGPGDTGPDTTKESA